MGSIAAGLVGGVVAGLVFVWPGMRILFGREGDRLDRFANWFAESDYVPDRGPYVKLGNAVFFVACCTLSCAFLTVLAGLAVRWAISLPSSIVHG